MARDSSRVTRPSWPLVFSPEHCQLSTLYNPRGRHAEAGANALLPSLLAGVKAAGRPHPHPTLGATNGRSGEKTCPTWRTGRRGTGVG